MDGWEAINKPETHVHFRKQIKMHTTERWPGGEGDEDWQAWLKTTFMEEGSKYNVWMGLPHEFLMEWKLAIYEPFKANETPTLWYIQPPHSEERRMYGSVAEWLHSQLIPRTPKILPEGFALVARRPTEDMNWFNTGIHEVDIYAALKRQSKYIDHRGRIVMKTIPREEKKEKEVEEK